jgi:acyl-CoA hydrolase
MTRDEPAATQLPDNVLRKLVSADQAVATIKPGEQVFVGTACATPRTLMAALENRRPPPPDVTCYHFLTNGAIPTDGNTVSTNYHHYSFFVGTDNRLAIAQGKADYIPISIAQVTTLLQNRRIAIDTALIQVSRPDRYGYVSLGVSVDIVHAAVSNAKTVLAEINPNMPRTMGKLSCMSTASTISSGPTCRSSNTSMSPPTRSDGRSRATSQASSAMAPPCRSAWAAFPMRP